MFDWLFQQRDPEGSARIAAAALCSAVALGGILLYATDSAPESVAPSFPVVGLRADLTFPIDTPDPTEPEAPPAPPPPPTRAVPTTADPRPGTYPPPTVDPPRPEAPGKPKGDTHAVFSASTAFRLGAPPGVNGRAFGARLPKPTTGPKAGAPAGPPSVPSAVRTVARTELRIRKRVEPIYPPTASIRTTCEAQIYIDPRGRPYRVDVSGCPPPFASATRRALLQWRWARPLMEGRPSAVRTRYTIHFEPEPPGGPARPRPER